MTRIYLDNCCFNRPYDDQSSVKIRLETEAKLMIQEKVKNKEFNLVWSYILEYENYCNPDEENRERISQWRKIASYLQTQTDGILKKSNNLQKLGMYP